MGWCSKLHLGLETAIGLGLRVAIGAGFGLRVARGIWSRAEHLAMGWNLAWALQLRLGFRLELECAICCN